MDRIKKEFVEKINRFNVMESIFFEGVVDEPVARKRLVLFPAKITLLM